MQEFVIYKRTLLKYFQIFKIETRKLNMFFILKLVVIILLNKTYAYITQDIEIILLPAWNPTGAKEIPLTLKVFGKVIQLNLRKNDQTVSPAFVVWKYKDLTEKFLSELKASDNCLYHHEDRVSSAVINFCQEHGLEGLVFLKNDILKIRPLRNDFASLSLSADFYVKEQVNLSFGKPHVIEKLLQYYTDTNFYHLNNFKRKPRYAQYMHKKYVIELAIFLDKSTYHKIKHFLNESNELLRIMILAYVNQIQVYFHRPSLGVSIDISLVHLEIMDEELVDVSDGNHDLLLNLFCTHAKARSLSRNISGHWDIALYLTDFDNYMHNSSQLIVGKSFSNGACNLSRSCEIVEFDRESTLSSGFTSSVIAAHEIGHLLGMYHDDKQCEIFFDTPTKHIMSPYVTHQGRTTWSMCSRDETEFLWVTKPCLQHHTKLEKFETDALDHSRYHDLPGRKWTAKAQCELFFRDNNANVVSLYGICQTLQCEAPNRNSYFTGPALEGTRCALSKECRGGECVPIIEPPYSYKFCRRDKWSEWKEEDYCKSGCLEKSRGVLVKRRFCRRQTHRTANCIAPYYDVILCDDSLVCTYFTRRETVHKFATIKCNEVKDIISLLDAKPGWQKAHEVDRPWIACTIFCFLKNDSIAYTPRLEMLNNGDDPYFPDGTWCHNEGGQDYYCRKHYCLPENYSFEESQEELLLKHYQNLSRNI